MSYLLWKWFWLSCGETTAMCTGVHLPTMHRHVAVSLLHNSPVLLLQEQKGRKISQWRNAWSRVSCVPHRLNQDVSILTSTSAAPGSLLKHMVMVFRAILKKLVKDTDFPCNKEALNVMSHSLLKVSEENKKNTPDATSYMVFGYDKTTIENLNRDINKL